MSKRGRRKARTLTLGEFFESGEGGEAPDTSPQPQSHFQRGGRGDRGDRGDLVLPQGPRASRGVDVDTSRLPESGSCTLLISNLSYESEESRLRLHLGSIKEMGEVTWNYKDGKKDGTAFVEFLSRDGAAAALGQTDTIFGGRKIVINVAERNAEGELIKEQGWRKRDSGPWAHDLYPQRGGWRESRGRGRYSDDSAEPGDDWRSREAPRERRDSSERDTWRDRDSSRYRSYGDRSPDGNRSFSRGRDERRGRRPWRPRGDAPYRRPYGREEGEPDSYRRSYGREESEPEPYRRSYGREEGEPEPYRRPHGREESEPDSWRRGGPDGEEAGDRHPRESGSPERNPSSAGPGIFGGARPVDTAAREREMESKMSHLSTDPSEGSFNPQRGQRGQRRAYRGDRDRRPYRSDGTEDRERRPYRTDRNDQTEERRPYRTDGTEDRRPYRTDRTDQTEDRGPRRGREERAPRGVFRGDERPNFAQNTRFSALEGEDN